MRFSSSSTAGNASRKTLTDSQPSRRLQARRAPGESSRRARPTLTPAPIGCRRDCGSPPQPVTSAYSLTVEPSSSESAAGGSSLLASRGVRAGRPPCRRSSHARSAPLTPGTSSASSSRWGRPRSRESRRARDWTLRSSEWIGPGRRQGPCARIRRFLAPLPWRRQPRLPGIYRSSSCPRCGPVLGIEAEHGTVAVCGLCVSQSLWRVVYVFVWPTL